MASDWDSYVCLIDGQPASIMLDLGLACQRCCSRHWLFWVRVALQMPDEHGMHREVEDEALFAIEDGLYDAMVVKSEAVYAGRLTTGGHRDFMYYAATTRGCDDAIASVMQNFPQYRYECGVQDDPQWSEYFNTLYPDGLAYQSIYNRRVIRGLTESGDALEVPRLVDHWFAFPTEATRQSFIEQVTAQGFHVQETCYDDCDEGVVPYGLHITRCDAVDLDTVNLVVTDLVKRAELLGAEYNGWGAPVVKK